MTNIKRVTALLLAALTALSLLSSCAGDTSGDSDAAVTTEAAQPSTQPSTTGRLEPQLPASDFEGYAFNFLVKGEEHNWYWCSHEIYASEENGEPINDSVYRRNRYLESKYNFSITETRVADPMGTARKSISAGDAAYDALMMGLSDSAQLAQTGMLTDLNKIPNLQLENPWWDQRAVEELSIGGKLYYALGDINIMDNDATWAIIFNKQLVADLGLDDPYTLVRNNQWTFDKFAEMCSAATKDLNGDGKMDENDRWGQLTEYLAGYIMYNGAGEYIAKKDSEDYPFVDMGGERSVAVLDKILNIMYDDNRTLFADDLTGKFTNPWDDCTRPMFKNSQGLFYTIGMGTVTLLRDMDTDYGLLPLPKYDSAQEEYHHPVGMWATSSVTVPTTNTNLERTGVILEAMAGESMYTLTPAYYETTIKHKAIRDEDSAEMLSIILSSLSYDVGSIYNWGSTSSVISGLIGKRSRDFSSAYEKIKDNAAAQVQKTIDAYKSIG